MFKILLAFFCLVCSHFFHIMRADIILSITCCSAPGCFYTEVFWNELACSKSKSAKLFCLLLQDGRSLPSTAPFFLSLSSGLNSALLHSIGMYVLLFAYVHICVS